MRSTSSRHLNRLRPRPVLLRGLALAALLLAPALPAVAADGVKVDVSVEGLSGEMKRNALGSMMLTAAASEGRLSEGEARRLVDRGRSEIAQSLQPFGYYRPVIRNDLEVRDGPWKARYYVQPGPPVLLRGVNVSVTGPGAELPRFRELVRTFPLAPGKRLEHAPYEALKTGLNRAAGQNGYLDASFSERRIAVDAKADTANVAVRFETGPRYFFGPVRFHQDILDESFLRTFVPFQTGEPYNVDSLLAMQLRLGTSPYFSRVEVEPQRDEATDLRVPIDVRLEPAKVLRWTLGGGYGMDTGFEATATLECRRLNRHGHRATLDVKVSEVRNTIGAQYQIPHAFGRDQLLTHSVAFTDEETDAQRSRGGSVGSTLTNVRGAWQQSIGLFFQRQDFTVGNDVGTPDLLMPEVSALHVRSDHRIEPRNGHRLYLLLRGSSDQVVSDASFVQLGAQAKLIKSAGPHRRIITRLEGGAVFTNDFHELPPNIRYFAGGAQSVRAYGYQELGPRDASNEPVGGQRLLFGSAEFEQRFFGSWGGAVFCDAGNALAKFGDPLAAGAGVGIRWFSPVGMVRFDVAWALREPPNHGQIQFAIGPDL